MQVPGPFEYERATSVDHAIGLLDRLGEGARVVAGGHSLLPMMKLRIANPEYLVDINDLAPELGYVVVGGINNPNLVRLGAMTRHREILDSDALAAVCPIFRDAERVIADPVVRNRGTLGGSLCQADPAEDLSTVCTVLDAVCLAKGPSGEREIAIDDFLVGPYETALAHNEVLIEVRIPLRHNTSSAYAKVERRVGDWAITAAGAAVTLDGQTILAARVGLTAVNPDPVALAELSAGLVGQPATEEVFAEAGRRAAQACTNMTVNGEPVTAEVEPRMLLVHFLRDQLRLTGTHWGCDTSNCGTCVVEVDGVPVKSCTMLAVMASGHSIRTVEGLAGPDGQLDPVQEGFMRCHGLQCGFCTPGMLITARALLDRNPDPDEQTIREAISGQICRCTGYTTIVRSIQWAAAHQTVKAQS